MFGLGFTEILVLSLIAFLVFGPKQFPLVAKGVLKFLNELRQTFTHVKTEFYDVETEIQKQVQQIKHSTTDTKKRVLETLSLEDNKKALDPLPKKDSKEKALDPLHSLPKKDK